MEVRPGYKRTEVGAIPEDWDTKTIGELFAFLSTSSCSRSDLSENGEVFYIHYGDIHTKWDYRLDFDLDAVPLISKEKVRNATLLADGDLILVDASEDEEGSGKSIEILNLKGRPAVAGLHTIALRCKNNELADGFKAYIQSMSVVRNQIRRLITGLKVFGISKTNLSRVVVPLLPLPEQRAIAEVLSDVDALIAALDRLIAKKRAIKQGTMQQLLTGQTRLPGFSGEWEVRKLEEVGEINKDNLGSNTSPDYSFKYISLEDVDFGVLRNYSEQVFNTAPSRARRIVKKSDVLISTVRPNLKSHLLIKDEILDFVCSTGFSVLTCNPAIAEPAYVYAHLFAYGIEQQIETLLSGSNYPAINSSDVKALQIPLPPLPEQRAIATILSDMDAEIAALEARRDKTRALKQGMMQELLTGKTRLV